jgi:glycine dehydrogenase subunit 1
VANDENGHPYMANSTAAARELMLDAVGARDVGELFEQIPDAHRRRGPLELPQGIRSEAELRRHLLDILRKNVDCEASLSFLGAGAWQHHVPAVCDEIVSRTEFVTSIWGTPSSDHGRNQAWFEFASMLGELLGFEFVGLPVYSWGCAAGHGIRMAARITGRRRVLLPRSLDPERLAVIRNYCEPVEMSDHIAITTVDVDLRSGAIDLADLEAKLSDDVAAVYFESPSFLGTIEAVGERIAALARAAGAETIVGADPISLGVLRAPADYGADIAVGPTQPLGVHLNGGGGVGGFIASRDEERYAREYPGLILSACETIEPGELGFGMALFEQSSYGSREDGKDWTGNSVYLWAIANAVYMALLGPRGFAEIGAGILRRSRYAAQQIASLPGADVALDARFFKEFVVDFNRSGKTVAEIDSALRERGIFGGFDLSASFPELGQSALYCVTEVHGKADVDRLVDALGEVLGG